MQDLFGEVGPVSYLKEKFELTPADIVKKVERVIARKQSAAGAKKAPTGTEARAAAVDS